MAEQGKYLTSFLEIYIDTDKNLENLALLDAQEQGTYYHEYLHYIQDVTTCSGLSGIWSSFDRFRQLVAFVQPAEIAEINVPLQGNVPDEQRSYIEFFKKLRGSGQIDGVSKQEADSYKIVEIQWHEDPEAAKYFPDFTAAKICLRLGSEGKEDKIFVFGETAISETMAYLLEKKFYPELNQLSKYPYQVAHELVEFLYADLLVKHENLFALCDIALMHNMPGWAFVQILNEMKLQEFTPQIGEDVIGFGYRFFDSVGWNYDGYLSAANEALQHISDQLFANPHFESTKLLFQASIERGRILRQAYPFGVLNIYKGANALSFNFYKVFNFLGGPHAVNRLGHRVVRVPYGLEELTAEAHPQHFRVIWQLNKFLIDGIRPCSLYRICAAVENEYGIDDRCETRPWRRAEDEFGCPYAAFWATYGFHLKEFYWNNMLIQQRAR